MTNIMTFVRTSKPIDLREWMFFENTEPSDFGDILMKGIAAKVTEQLRAEFENDPPRLQFPFGWSNGDGQGGPRPSDPVMLYVSLPLGENDDACCYSCSLEGVVDDLIELREETPGKITDEEAQATCRSVATRLRELADKLDAACK